MDDLVTRLRKPNDGWCYGCWDDLPEKAADRIEQLEAALQIIADSCAEDEWPDSAQLLARAALGDKKNG
jgi:hypothetical protein